MVRTLPFHGNNTGSNPVRSVSLQVGCSKMLAWDGKLWFEPYFGIHMPARNESMGMGLGMQFRFAF